MQHGAVTKLPKPAPRSTLRMGLPSKGRMAEDTMQLLKDSALSVYKPNSRQYVASIPQIPGLEVWFQRASDVVRKLRLGDIDLGIVGTDMYEELGEGDSDLVVVHEALNFGHCHLALGVPMFGRFERVDTLQQLRDMGWSEEQPLRVVTGYTSIARRFFAAAGFEHVALLAADGALEAAPAMGTADIILDLGVLVANRRSLLERPGLLGITRELLERFDAHLKAAQFYSVTANMRGETPEAVSTLLLQDDGLQGLQGPTVSPVYTITGDDARAEQRGFFACVICVPKKKLYSSVKVLQKLGGSGVLVQPMTYIFDEEPERWQRLLATLEIDEDTAGLINGGHGAPASNGTR
ncbi:ATP phosphoribosyltransferase [Monoraphidium neglectum]|uniref:ATP phosphoribosyltransferase n=1 Tax=Monoraphidium neglectum TaxID=145388 RepID=A0A0D2KXA0_9CHLO|nr:ATP phosphoribosyltransferase [Monoraphidium neglectum]KIY99933.1 ATP phosphoribosyltransferase [Monoraphidium neglectum]|eukprot:XP_013898953.1 ATP phosphoribosyltransferase [Monoraphidium neglectum]